jgi:hypothetical protein
MRPLSPLDIAARLPNRSCRRTGKCRKCVRALDVGGLSLLLLSSILSILSNCRCCVVVVLIARSAFFLACFEFRSSLSFLSAYAGSYVLLSLPL